MWSLSPPPGPSLLLVLSDSLELACNGLTDKLHRGSVVFLPSEREAKFYPKVEEKETLLFQAYCSLWWQYVQQIGLSRYFLFNSFLFCIFENYWSSFDWFNCMFVCVIYSMRPPWAGTGPACQTLQQLAQELKGTYENHSWTQRVGFCVSSFPSFGSQICPCGSWAWWVRVYTQWQRACFYPICGCPGGSCKSRTSTRRPDYGAEWIEY